MFPAHPGDCIEHLRGKIADADLDTAVARIRLYASVAAWMAVVEQREIDTLRRREGNDGRSGE